MAASDFPVRSNADARASYRAGAFSSCHFSECAFEHRLDDSASNALAMIIAGASTGELLPSEGESLSNIVNSFMKSIELSELETRLVALEKANAPPEGRAYDA